MGEAVAEADAGGTREEVPEKVGIRRELRALTRLALPIQAVSMLSFSMQVVVASADLTAPSASFSLSPIINCRWIWEWWVA
jgi:hypothetical protein